MKNVTPAHQLSFKSVNYILHEKWSNPSFYLVGGASSDFFFILFKRNSTLNMICFNVKRLVFHFLGSRCS